MNRPLLGHGQRLARILAVPVFSLTISPALPAWAADAIETKETKPDTLPEISVKSSRVKQDAVVISPSRTITTIEAKELERTQPTTLFEAIRDTPGIAIEGGPRPSGMSFNVRGYSDTDDVQVRIDNVPKGFQKYRFGGTFVEPDLLKSIEVQRGPQISSGSGSLGGTILAKTKDGADFLRPGERYGGRIKLGYASNNDEYLRSTLVYARPIDTVDILYNRTDRHSNDITHSDGSKLEMSNVDSKAQLFKLNLFPIDTLEIRTAITLLEESGLQPYDATGSSPTTFGNVIRSIEDLSVAQTVHWNPDHPWIDLTATVGWGHTKLEDLSPPGFGRNLTGSSNLYEHRNFKNRTVDISNNANLYRNQDWRLDLLAGLQYFSMDKEVRRTHDIPTESTPADGFWAASVSGKTDYSAMYLQPRLQYGRWGLIPGVRVDWYEVSSTEERVQHHLAEKGMDDQINFRHATYSMGLTFDLIPEQLSLFANYGQGFRPPTVDEYFTYGRSAGAPASRPATWPPFLPWPGPGQVAGLGNPYGGGEGRCNTPATNFICGDVYKLQTSESSELGVHYQKQFKEDAGLTAKFTYFHINTQHLLRYFNIDAVSNTYVPQNAWERRNGTEFEANFNYRQHYLRANYSRTWGTFFDGDTTQDIFTVPSNTLNLTLGSQILPNLGVNMSYRKVSARTVFLNTNNYGTQDGYELVNAGAYWSPNQNVTLRFIGENLLNRDYDLNAGGDFSGMIGNRGPGRNLRFITELRF